MNNPANDVSIIDKILNGEVEIQTTEEFEEILNTFPEHPGLNKAFADFLAREQIADFACHEYCRSAQLFLNKGMPLQAIGAKLQEWQIITPAPEDYHCFFDSFRGSEFTAATLGECLGAIGDQEWNSLLQNMEIINLAPESQVLRKGQPEEALYFVLSGELRQAEPTKSGNAKDSTAKMFCMYVANDFFGKIHPLDQKHRAGATIITNRRTELLKLPKASMVSICKKHPQIDTVLAKLYEHAETISNEAQSSLRKSSRQSFCVPIHLELYPTEPGRRPQLLQGFSSDISLGGICLFLDARHRNLPTAEMIGRTARVIIGLPDETVALTLLGKLAWSKKALIGGETTGVLGIQFDEMPPAIRGYLVIFANAIGTAIMATSNGNTRRPPACPRGDGDTKAPPFIWTGVMA